MWRILNWLFGWDYIVGRGVIYRIRTLKTLGGEYYHIKSDYQGLLGINEANKQDNLIWLTCKPEKYLGRE